MTSVQISCLIGRRTARAVRAVRSSTQKVAAEMDLGITESEHRVHNQRLTGLPKTHTEDARVVGVVVVVAGVSEGGLVSDVHILGHQVFEVKK